jgi:hypothetical protein
VQRPLTLRRPNPTEKIVSKPETAQTRSQRKKTGRKKSTTAVKGVGGQNRSVAVGKRAAPTTPSTTRKALTRAQSRRRERVAESTVAQQQRAARKAANQAKRTARKTANQAKRATRMARRTR